MSDETPDKAAADEAEVKRLAGLSPLDYDRARDAAAKKLGVRGETLDSVVAPLRPKAAEPPKPTKAVKRYGNPPKGKYSNTDPTRAQLAAAKAARDAAQQKRA